MSAFNIGGQTDMVAHEHKGYLAKANDTQDLARGIIWMLDQRDSGRLYEQAGARAV